MACTTYYIQTTNKVNEIVVISDTYECCINPLDRIDRQISA